MVLSTFLLENKHDSPVDRRVDQPSLGDKRGQRGTNRSIQDAFRLQGLCSGREPFQERLGALSLTCPALAVLCVPKSILV